MPMELLANENENTFEDELDAIRIKLCEART
jgi:hypothetical protein